MNSAIFWRLVWKEYRIQRAFWVSMAVLTALLELIVLVSIGKPSDRTPLLFAVGLALPAFYALGCGATLFATEHEAGTYEFQRILPVSAMRLFFGKLAFGVLSTAALILLMCSSAAVLAGWRLPEPDRFLALWGLFGFAAVEMFLWGAFFSLLTTRPLKAAILAVAATSLCDHLIVSFYVTKATDYTGAEFYLAAILFRAVVAAVVAIADLRLGRRWFAETAKVRPAPWRIGRRGPSIVATATPDSHARLVQRHGLGRLLWQQCRQSARMMPVVAGVTLLLALVLAWHWVITGYRGHNLFLVAVATTCAVSLIGSCTFLADQQGYSFRFFAEHGIRPRHVWLSRQVVWGSAALVLAAVSLPPLLLGLPLIVGVTPPSARGLQVLLGARFLAVAMILCLANAYSAGQLCSMFFRSGLLAGVFGLVLTAVLCGWTGRMAALEIPLVWSVAPIPLVLLLATWLRAPGWILERNSVKAWTLPLLSLAAPAAALLAAVATFRVFEVPAVDPGFSPEEYGRPLTAEEQVTAEMFQRASQAYVPLNDVEVAEGDAPAEAGSQARAAARKIAWLKANEKAIAITLAASRRTAQGAINVFRRGRLSGAGDLGHLLIASAGQLQLEGNLDAALERYLAALRVSVQMRDHANALNLADFCEMAVYEHLPSWAAEPDQTPQRIRKAILQLDDITKNLPSRGDAIKSQYLLIQGLISADPDAVAAVDMTPHDAFLLYVWSKCFPWERVRARRVLNFITARNLEKYHSHESAAAPCGCCWRWRGGSSNTASCRRRSTSWWARTWIACRWTRILASRFAISPRASRFPWNGPMPKIARATASRPANRSSGARASTWLSTAPATSRFGSGA